MSRRSRKRRVLSGGGIGWRVGFGPGEPHWPGDADPPDVIGDEGPGRGPFDEGPPGGVREPRRPKPTLPGMSEHLPLPEPPVHADARSAMASG
ncbi:MAG: hypothetical protein HOV86_23530 [Thermoactinospora sp.]|nr:hypothetical protein [Thermoactinospora sp.]